MKVVINKCYGGFGLSTKAHEWLIKNKGWGVTDYTATGSVADKDCELVRSGDTSGLWSRYQETEKVEGDWGDWKLRINPDVIEAIEALGEKDASSGLAQLEIVEIPDGIEWEIDNYDGIETIHEEHRSW